MKKQLKYLIFDLGGVLFEYPRLDFAHLLKHSPETNPFEPIERGIELLKASHKASLQTGHTFYILSNWKKERFELLARHYPDVIGIFEGAVISGVCGYAKPDERIFHHLFNTHGLMPEECVFIDDAQKNITVAHELGMHGVLCDDFEGVEKELRELGLM